MGKNEILDSPCNPKMMESISIKKTGAPTSLLVTFLLLPLISGCAFPRIIVLEDPLTPEEHLNLGVAYEEKGEFESAIKEYRLAAKKLPLAYLYLGNVHFHRDEFTEAEKYYKKSVKKEPNNADAYNNLAWLYYMRNDKLDEAEGLARKAVELNSLKIHIYKDTLEKIMERKKTIR